MQLILRSAHFAFLLSIYSAFCPALDISPLKSNMAAVENSTGCSKIFFLKTARNYVHHKLTSKFGEFECLNIPKLGKCSLGHPINSDLHSYVCPKALYSKTHF